MSSHPTDSPGDSAVVMARCSDCGHMVPETNLAIHQAHACGARARHESTNTRTRTNEQADTTTIFGMRQRRHHTTAADTTTTPPPQQARQSTTVRQQDNVIDLASDDNDEVQIVEPPSAAAARNNNNNNEWACPRCTLLNPTSHSSCGACQYSKNPQTTTRTADATRRERLVEYPSQQQQHQSQPPSPGTFVGGGALLGSMLGAAGAAMRGGSIVGGAMEGAVSGAMGGAVLGSSTQQMAMQQQQRAAHRQQYPRSSMRVNRSNSGHHTTTTIFTSPDGRVQRRVVVGGPGGVDPLLGFLMANAMQNQQHGMNIDGMSYEQLLEAFGDGSENRGADERTIASLPVSRVQQDTKSDKAEDVDHVTCSICLERFQKGDSRMTLPCLHGFHDQCVSKWLRSNGTCPICKHPVAS